MDLIEFLTSLGISWSDYKHEWRPLGQESIYIDEDDCFVCEIKTKKRLQDLGVALTRDPGEIYQKLSFMNFVYSV